MRRLTTPILLLAGCGARLSGNAIEGEVVDASAPSTDAALSDTAAPDGAPLGPWSAPAKVGVASTDVDEEDVTLSSSALEMVFVRVGAGGKELYYSSRASAGAPWQTAAPLMLNGSASGESPRFSSDDRTLYFASDRRTVGDLDIYAVARPAAGSTQWGPPGLVAGVNTGADEKWFSPCDGGRYVVVRSTNNNGTDLFEGTLGGGAPTPIDSLNTADGDTGAFLTRDCLTLYFASFRTTPEKIFVSRRTAAAAPWPAAAPVDDFKLTGGNGNQEDPWLSSDTRTFVFASDASGSKDVYLSTR